jgi:transcription factor IIIB subunit 2
MALELEREYVDRIGESPHKIMKLAFHGMFLDNGSNLRHYAAASLYIALRYHKAPYLLMDFSEKMQINLYKLARVYKRLAKYLNVVLHLNEKLPTVDPSIYIPRFC